MNRVFYELEGENGEIIFSVVERDVHILLPDTVMQQLSVNLPILFHFSSNYQLFSTLYLFITNCVHPLPYVVFTLLLSCVF